MAVELVLPENPAQQLREQHLIQRFRDGEHELFYELVQPYEWRVNAAAFAILSNEADAEDAAQEGGADCDSARNVYLRHEASR